MALLANTVPLRGSKLSRVYHRFARSNVIASRAVASLAGYATFPKRRRGVGVLSAWNPLNPTGVTLQASRQDRPCQVRVIVRRVAGRGLPRSRAAIVRDGCFIQESLDAQQIAT